jgi:hypothetical protein
VVLTPEEGGLERVTGVQLQQHLRKVPGIHQADLAEG